ncbi:Ankyrin repeat and protein kinase domain-containing protein 1 [Tulasnella sp. UAMH 9824]|nr:Ankyrin repeat and protein kinase domain-containing protein 1 [Tulasnella sp. UAMH 9824]
MEPYLHEEITRLPYNPDEDSDYRPVLYRPDSTQLAQRRIDAVGEIDPKRILKCYGYRYEDRPFMIVDLEGKESLARLVGQGDLNLLEKLKLLYEAGKALQYLHSRSPPSVHGAVHPRTIFVTKPNSAVLSDFGLANLWRLFEDDTSFHPGAMAGVTRDWLSPGAKVGYTAPEYIMDDTAEMLPPADIYSFASVILAVLSSRHPFTGVKTWSPKGLAAITQGVPPDPEDHPNLAENDSLWPLLRQMWSRDPADRPAIDEVMEQLEQEIKIRSGEAVPKTIGHEDPETPQKV